MAPAKGLKTTVIVLLAYATCVDAFASGAQHRRPSPPAGSPEPPPPPRELQRNWKLFKPTQDTETKYEWYFSPVTQWDMLNFQELFPMKVLSKGDPEHFETLPKHPDKEAIESNIDQHFSYPSPAKSDATMSDWLADTETDGILIMHRGMNVYERYFGNQTKLSRHRLFSASKSFVGIAAEMLIHRKYLNATDLVAGIVPAMNETALGNATVRQVLDMTTAFRWSEAPTPPEGYDNCLAAVLPEVYAALDSNGKYPLIEGCEFDQYDLANNYALLSPEDWKTYLNVCDRPGPENIREFLTLLVDRPRDEAHHGEKFEYKTANTDLMTWIIDETLRAHPEINALSTAEYIGNTLWSKVGQGSDALVTIDDSHVPYFGSGMTATLPDMARWGEVLREGGKNKRNEEVIPKEIINDLHNPPKSIFEMAPNYNPKNSTPLRAYRSHFWMMKSGLSTETFFYQEGYNGQYVAVFPHLDCVVAKHSHDSGFLQKQFYFLYAMEALCKTLPALTP